MIHSDVLYDLARQHQRDLQRQAELDRQAAVGERNRVAAQPIGQTLEGLAHLRNAVLALRLRYLRASTV